MDRLSDAAREALGSYRDTLALEGRRVDRNWSAIERRAASELDAGLSDAADTLDAPAPRDDRAVPAPRARNTVAILAAAVAVAAAIVAVVAVGPGLADEHRNPVDGAAAYEVTDPEPERIEPTMAPAGARAGRASVEAPSVATPSNEAPSVEAPSVEAPSHETPSNEAPSVATPKLDAARGATRPPKRSAPAAAPSSPAPTLERDPTAVLLAETALLRRARTALRDGDPSAALAATDAYARRFAGGTLSEEIAFVRLTALCESGRIDEGRAAARSFAERYPDSPLSARAAKSCGPS